MTDSDKEFFDNLLGDNMNEGFGKEYNMFCCEQGIIIAKALENKEAIIEFHKSSWAEQKAMVPGLDDGHSGNTFGMSCRLAIEYLPMLRDNKIEQILNKNNND